jgi:membrane protease YdiL (CAAX protease family)
LLTLLAAIGLCALVVAFGGTLAEQAIGWLSPAAQQSDPALETLFTFVVYGALLLFGLAGAFLSGVNPLRLGRRPGHGLSIGAALGLFGLAAAAGYAWVAGALGGGEPTTMDAGLLAWGTALILFAVVAEEIYFRGWVQPVLARQFGTAAAVFLSALAFAALHVMGGVRSPTSLLNLFLGGLLFGLLAARSGGLAGAVGAHFAWNWTEQILLGIDPNPGVGSFGAIANLELAGPAIWGGSDEGLNASIAMTIALLAMLAPLLIMARQKPAGSEAPPPIGGARTGTAGA